MTLNVNVLVTLTFALILYERWVRHTRIAHIPNRSYKINAKVARSALGELQIVPLARLAGVAQQVEQARVRLHQHCVTLDFG